MRSLFAAHLLAHHRNIRENSSDEIVKSNSLSNDVMAMVVIL